ncbi:hypothetical protein [Paraburkholderia pallida]|uniref:Uncharacterized protein n=1 Tax=Paraburkholderia pallida TaxID=2547399 RepID=A0A4P7CWD4_9BURK|nr:hypothetical protein [Paraburkholderia pallida]QBR00499.1 hypothetical protein E1956_26050 [Paraburkholderia pallida]
MKFQILEDAMQKEARSMRAFLHFQILNMGTGMAINFEEDFFIAVKERPYDAVLEIDDELARRAEFGATWDEGDYEYLLEAYALIKSMLDGELIAVSDRPTAPNVTGDVESDCKKLAGFIENIGGQCKRKAAKARLANLERSMQAKIGTAFAYEFSQGDLDRVQELINELRGLISESDKFEEKHQRRLLMRLERLQSELHKRMSDLDHLWGLVGDAGVAIGKLGKDAKPIIDRVKEITTITWRTQARSEELPSGAPFPQLEDRSSNDAED